MHVSVYVGNDDDEKRTMLAAVVVVLATPYAFRPHSQALFPDGVSRVHESLIREKCPTSDTTKKLAQLQVCL